jgi:integrase
MAKAWIFQERKQVEKHGADNATWRVGWIDPEGRRKSKGCGSGKLGIKTARKLRQKIEAELLEGTYKRSNDKKTWEDFRHDYDRRILAGMLPQSARCVRDALNRFERVIKPKYMKSIKTTIIDDFIAERKTERGKHKEELISPASVNKELRHLKHVLRIAHEWGDLNEVPRFHMLKEPGKEPTFITGEHFTAVYTACDKATLPAAQPYPAADWWRGLVTMAYMTGWRIGDLLALRRNDVDLDKATALSRAENNKGKRDERVNLHPVVVEHLKRLAGFDPCMFPWKHNLRRLYAEFARIQEAAGIKLPCDKGHEHTRFCHVYGFHDFRRAFATVNAKKLSPDDLQLLMRHKSYLTTKKYINMVSRLEEAVAVLHVPDVLKKVNGG